MAVTIYIAADDLGTRRLWLTDGTPDGTATFDAIMGEAPFTAPFGLVSLGGLSYFSAEDAGGVNRLWVTDGTAEGTAILGQTAAPCFVYGDRILATGNLTGAGYGLYITDGTAAGTSLLAEGTYFANGTVIDGKFYFEGMSSSSGRELWVSDGTAGGTQMVVDATPGAANSDLFGGFLGAAAKTFFTVWSETTRQSTIWVTDGTAGGSLPLRSLAPNTSWSFTNAFSNGSPTIEIGGKLFFIAAETYGTSSVDWWRNGVWASDGTVAGTQQVLDLGYYNFGGDNAYVWMFASAGGKLVFGITDVSGNDRVYASDGTSGGTQLIATLLTQYSWANIGSYLVFGGRDTSTGEASLYRTDGTAAGTVEISDLVPQKLVAFDGALFFTAYDPSTQAVGLFRTDGTGAGTVAVAEIGGTPGSFSAFVDGGRMFFILDKSGGNADELWVTDGTTAGTVLLKTFAGNGTPSFHGIVDGKVLLLADDGVHGAELWASDGTTAGTGLLADAAGAYPDATASLDIAGLVDIGGKLVARMADPASGAVALRVLDTESGSSTPLQSVGGVAAGDSSEWIVVGGRLFFVAPGSDDPDRPRVWASDGTNAGTSILFDSAANGMIFGLTRFGDDVVVVGRETGSGTDNLFSIDGVSGAVTQLVAGVWFADPFEFNGRLYFQKALEGGGTTLWSTDGTAAGTAAVTGMTPSAGVVAGSRMFFSGHTDAAGDELWVSDAAGTRIVRNALGSDSGLPTDITAVGEKVVFTYAALVPDLWVSDGTNAGTVMIKDVTPSPRAFLNHDFVSTGSRAFFTVTDPTSWAFTNWTEALWTTDGTAAGTFVIDQGQDVEVTILRSAGDSLLYTAGQQVRMITGAGTVHTLGVLSPGGSPSVLFEEGQLYLAFTDATQGQGLFRLDGTSLVLVKSGVVDLDKATVLNGELYFVASDSVDGTELWKTDGTQAGTVRVTDTIGIVQSGIDLPWTGSLDGVAPFILGAEAGQATSEIAPLASFDDVRIVNPGNAAEALAVTVQLDDAAKGAFTAASLSASGFGDAGGGRYIFSGTAAAATAALRLLVFDPADGRVSPGSTETTQFTVTATNAHGASTNAVTSVVSSPVSAPYDITIASGAASVAELTANGSALFTVVGHDFEAGTSFTYALADSAGGRFSIDSLTGAVIVADGLLLDFEQFTSHGIIIRVSDGTFTFDKQFTVAVTDWSPEYVQGDGRANTFYGGFADDFLYGGGGNDALVGNAGNDVLLGEDGNDTLNGGGGRDTLDGGAGADSLVGGADADIFRFAAVSDIGMALNARDVITDFQPELDRIDLSQIDALTTVAGHQIFTFLGTGAHTGTGATLRYLHAGGNTLLYGDVDANGGADFTVQINGIHQLTGRHFTAGSIGEVRGGTGNDTLEGNDIGSQTLNGLGGNDVMDGRENTDIMRGGAGFDTMTGGSGTDYFDFDLWSDIGLALNARDIITDFQQGQDKLDFDDLDGNSKIAGLQHFTFLGTNNHTGLGATLRYLHTGGNTLLYGDVDANGAADFALQINGIHVLNADDFTAASIAAIQGGAANDTLFGMFFYGKLLSGMGGNDVLIGYSGGDTLRGGAGFDTMTGGAGSDRFDINDVAEIGLAAGARDVITDFEQGADLIDLDGVDASSLLAGRQAFTWLGTAAHSGAGATLRYVQSGGNTLVEGDVDGNGTSDFALQLNGLIALTAADFTNASISTIQGTGGNDVLTGAPGGRLMRGLDGNDTITGGAGADTIVGGNGVDLMTGGAGADRFVFTSIAEIGLALNARDIIAEFQKGVDRIDLSAIDANTKVAGDQAFTFIGTANHGAGATLRYTQTGTFTVIWGDTDANGAADFALQITGLFVPTAADFVL